MACGRAYGEGELVGGVVLEHATKVKCVAPCSSLRGRRACRRTMLEHATKVQCVPPPPSSRRITDHLLRATLLSLSLFCSCTHLWLDIFSSKIPSIQRSPFTGYTSILFNLGGKHELKPSAWSWHKNSTNI
jgi:hypothetical protein